MTKKDHFENYRDNPINSETNPVSLDNLEHGQKPKNESVLSGLESQRQEGATKPNNKFFEFMKTNGGQMLRGAKRLWEGGKTGIAKVQYEIDQNQQINELRKQGEDIPETDLESFESYQTRKQTEKSDRAAKKVEAKEAEVEANTQLEIDLEDLEKNETGENLSNELKVTRSELKKMGLSEKMLNGLKNIKEFRKDFNEYYNSLSSRDKAIVCGGLVALGGLTAVGLSGVLAATGTGYGSFNAVLAGSHLINGVAIESAKTVVLAKVQAGIFGTVASAISTERAFAFVNKVKSNKLRNNQTINTDNIETVSTQASFENDTIPPRPVQKEQEPSVIDVEHEPAKQNANGGPKKSRSIFDGIRRDGVTPEIITVETVEPYTNPDTSNAQSPKSQLQENSQTPKLQKRLNNLKENIVGLKSKAADALSKFRERSELTKKNKYQSPLTQDQIKTWVAENNLNPELAEPMVSEKELQIFLSGKEEYYIKNKNDDLEPYSKDQIDSMLESGLVNQGEIQEYSSFNFGKAAEQIINSLGGEGNTILAQKINSLVMEKVSKDPESYLLTAINEKFPNINNPKQILEILNKNNPDSVFSKTTFDAEDYLRSYGEVLSSMKSEINDLKRESELQQEAKEYADVQESDENSTLIQPEIKPISEATKPEITVSSNMRELLDGLKASVPVVESAPQHLTTKERRSLQNPGLREKLDQLSGKTRPERKKYQQTALENLKNTPKVENNSERFPIPPTPEELALKWQKEGLKSEPEVVVQKGNDPYKAAEFFDNAPTRQVEVTKIADNNDSPELTSLNVELAKLQSEFSATDAKWANKSDMEPDEQLHYSTIRSDLKEAMAKVEKQIRKSKKSTKKQNSVQGSSNIESNNVDPEAVAVESEQVAQESLSVRNETNSQYSELCHLFSTSTFKNIEEIKQKFEGSYLSQNIENYKLRRTGQTESFVVEGSSKGNSEFLKVTKNNNDLIFPILKRGIDDGNKSIIFGAFDVMKSSTEKYEQSDFPDMVSSLSIVEPAIINKNGQVIKKGRILV